MLRNPVSLSLLILTTAAMGVASQPDPNLWTAEDIVQAQSIGEAALSPDAGIAVWAQSDLREVDDELKRVSNLKLCRLDGGAPVPLTRGNHTVSAPAFSPNGEHVAFLSDRPVPGGDEEIGETQVWTVPVGGGEAFPVTQFRRSVRLFSWIDESTLVMAAQELPLHRELERKKAEDAAEVVDDPEHEPPVRLFIASLEEGVERRLTTNEGWIDRLRVAPGGNRAVVRIQRSPSWEFDQKVPPSTAVVDLASGKLTPVLEGRDLIPVELRWAMDSRGVYFTNEHTSHPRYRTATVTHLWYLALPGGVPERVELDWPRGIGGSWRPVSGGVIALLADGVRYRPALIVRGGEGWVRRPLEGEHVQQLFDIQVSSDGHTVLYERSSATLPTQWYAASLDGDRLQAPRQLTDLNPTWANRPTGLVEVVRWEGARGDRVEGLLHYPLDWSEGRAAPLILDIHGGPTGTDMDRWSQSWASPNILWRQRGAFVLQVNYHGSAGYGLAWAESIRGRYYELEIPDLERGVDAVIERGLADPERLASSGWSNGGILTAELITRTQRYSAASIGAADVEWISDWANVDFGASFDNYYFGGPPWERIEHYVEKSPFFRLTEVKTPTVIYTGTADRNVPPHQSWSLFRALQQLERAPTRLVLFPDEPHGLRKPAHQLRKIAEDVAFFDRYLFGEGQTRDSAVPDSSLLAARLARARAGREDGRFGERVNGVLVPETVSLGELKVGRFEVTCAQWVEFAKVTGKVSPCDGDAPVTGIDFGDARMYVQWLSDTTGRGYRLPTEEEAERLTSLAGDGGNTLDHWAGYGPNPEDARALRRSAEALGPRALLLPVGSFPGVGEEPVFDLDGNAAEWAMTTDGGGSRVGPSADRPSNDLDTTVPQPEYTGLRVVMGSRAAR